MSNKLVADLGKSLGRGKGELMSPTESFRLRENGSVLSVCSCSTLKPADSPRLTHSATVVTAPFEPNFSRPFLPSTFQRGRFRIRPVGPGKRLEFPGANQDTEWRGAKGVDMQTGAAIPRPLHSRPLVSQHTHNLMQLEP